MNLTQTGRFITQLRTAMGLTQAQLAQRLDVTDKAVSKWERGKSLPDITLLNRLAAELRVSVVEILSGKPLKVERSSNLDDVSSWEGDRSGRISDFKTCGTYGFTGLAVSVRQQFGAYSFLSCCRSVCSNAS